MTEELIKAKLYGGGLVRIRSAALVERYNRCLERLGAAPTKLAEFRIDGMGWSPEVAEEKGEQNYLCPDIASQAAIIVSLDQRKMPIYVPFSSYTRRLVGAFFSRYKDEIADITSTNVIALAIDHGISRIKEPHELLAIDHVVVTTMTDSLVMAAAREQHGLVDRFLADDEAWLNEELRQSIIASGEQHGDLRRRKLDIPEMRFDDLRSFHVRLFGGVFVIRTEEGKEDVLVVEDKASVSPGTMRRSNVFHVLDRKLIESLYSLGVIEVDFDWYQKNPEEINMMLECMMADTVCSGAGDVDYISLSPVQRKRLASDKLPDAFHELERLRKMLSRNVAPSFGDLSRETQLLLLRPHERLPNWYQEVIWQLLLRITQINPLQLYAYDKNLFFRIFDTWPASKQMWAVNLIASNHMSRTVKE